MAHIGHLMSRRPSLHLRSNCRWFTPLASMGLFCSVHLLGACSSPVEEDPPPPSPQTSDVAPFTSSAPSNPLTEPADETSSDVSPGASAPSTSSAPDDSAPTSAESPAPTDSAPNLAPSPTSTATPAVDPTRPGPSPVFTPDDSSIRPGSGPLGVEKTCDGKDDDKNGVLDDVDVDQDGVCDCLRVATLGLHGDWGNGDVVTGWLNERLQSKVGTLDGEPLTKARLAPYQVLLIRDISVNNNPSLSFSQAEVDALWEWVRSGGGLMTVVGYSGSGELGNVNRLLEPYGLSYGTEAIIPGNGSAAPITQWFEHPITEGITRVGADNGYPTTGQGITVAAEAGHDVGKAVTIGDGHVFIWADEWVTYETEWRNDSAYQVERFWKNTLRWLTRVNECQVNID